MVNRSVRLQKKLLENIERRRGERKRARRECEVDKERQKKNELFRRGRQVVLVLANKEEFERDVGGFGISARLK